MCTLFVDHLHQPCCTNKPVKVRHYLSKFIIQHTNRGCCSIVHESGTMTFDQTPFITLLCSVWYVGADPTVKEAFTENGVRSGAYNVVEVPRMS